ncbi:hypothetical protein [Pseudomonas sp. KCJK9111]|uniref:hypothetical protein n=1 Tax=Pseudomonas sp. KCJK9111 TaxID=3344555 RepID=UPI003905CEF4
MEITMIQHPVGQGGLFSGELQSNNSVLRWVYDCGSNQQDRLKEEIIYVASRGSIDLLFLSHLDSDHVNGVDRLLAATCVREVVLPYLSASEFAVAVATDVSTGALSGTFLEFVTDPSKWLIARGVRTVSFVQAVVEGRPLGEWLMPEPDGEATRRDDNRGLTIQWSEPAIKSRVVKGATVQNIAAGNSIAVTQDNSRIEWLLAPYAHKPSGRRIAEFQNALERSFGKGLTRSSIVAHARNEPGREKLKECYGALWSDHNKVSMSLYAGPQASPIISNLQLPFGLWRTPLQPMTEIGWLMTGDADLAARRRVNALMTHYAKLLDRVGVLVLPHHGSDLSFHRDLILDLPNLNACVVAAGPNQYGHPHSEVFKFVKNFLGFDGWHHVSQHPTSGYGVRAVI